MQNYIRNGLRYPNSQGVKLRDWEDRLRHIDSLLTHFPRTKGTTAPKTINLEELKHITMRAVPNRWMTELHTSVKRLDTHMFPSLIDYLEALQSKENLKRKRPEKEVTFKEGGKHSSIKKAISANPLTRTAPLIM